MGSAFGFGTGEPGLIPSLCVTMCFLPDQIRVEMLNKGGPFIEYYSFMGAKTLWVLTLWVLALWVL